MVRMHRNLLHVGPPLERVDQQVGHRTVTFVDGNQDAVGRQEYLQLSESREIVVYHGVHAQVPEHLSCRCLDLRQHRQGSSVRAVRITFPLVPTPVTRERAAMLPAR